MKLFEITSSEFCINYEKKHKSTEGRTQETDEWRRVSEGERKGRERVKHG